MTGLPLSRAVVRYRDLELEAIWYPGRTLDAGLGAFLDDVDAANAARGRRLSYGFFDPAASAEDRRDFLRSTIWVVVRRAGRPAGFVYSVDLGSVDLGPAGGARVIHAGLVRFSETLGPAAMAAAYALVAAGGVRNYGPHFCTNVTHLPLIAGLFDAHARDVFPSPRRGGTRFPPEYLPAVRRLRDRYVVPVLGLPAETLCEETARLRGSLLDAKGFVTLWRVVPKYADPAYTALLESRLAFRTDAAGRPHVCDDLVQVGRIDRGALSTLASGGPAGEFETVALEGDAPPWDLDFGVPASAASGPGHFNRAPHVEEPRP